MSKGLKIKRVKWKYPTKENGKPTRMYNIWNSIQQRCYNKNNKNYNVISKLGIDVIWNNYDMFYEWSMNNGYTEKSILNRVNKEIGYYPDNCKWVSKEQQTYSKRKKNKWNNVVCENGKYTKLFLIWYSIIARTTNPKNKDYKYYSNLGVCNEWLNYDNFHNWALSNGYNDTLTIDRIDNDKGYYPNNCQFISFKENARKQKRRILIDGKSLLEISEEYGIKKPVLYDRYLKGDRTIEEIIKPRKCVQGSKNYRGTK